MSTVFISYRRQTAPGEARALFNDLVSRLGKSSVFMDVDSIALGRDFRRVLRKTLESCDLMLVVIDKNWVEAKDEEGRTRLKSPDDFVRMEIETALKRDIVVTPILVEGAQMPTTEQLPREIEDLAYRNAFELTHNRWESDVQEMVRRLGLVSSEQALEIETDHPPTAPPRDPTPPAGGDPSTQRRVLVLVTALIMVIITASSGGLLLINGTPGTTEADLAAERGKRDVNSATVKQRVDDNASAKTQAEEADRRRAEVQTSPQPTGNIAQAAPIDCKEERTLRSLGTTQSTSITVVNRGEQPVRLYWLDFDGKRMLYATLTKNQAITQLTYLTHPWIVTDLKDECHAIYMPTPQKSEINVAI